FFQAEDGIRDFHVTGVQTCALPIYYGQETIEILLQDMENRREDLVVILAGYKDRMERFFRSNPGMSSRIAHHIDFPDYSAAELRSEERRVGKEWRSGGGQLEGNIYK